MEPSAEVLVLSGSAEHSTATIFQEAPLRALVTDSYFRLKDPPPMKMVLLCSNKL